MFAIVGAAGRVGQSTSAALREAGVPVRAILRTAAKAPRLEALGCEIAVADLQDAGALAQAIAGADAVQIVLPVVPGSKDPAADLSRSIDGLVAGLEKARPKRVLAISDYGAHVAEDIGMPSVFRVLEERLRRIGGETVIVVLRSAEHMHNWERVIPVALSSGILPTFQDPVDQAMPTTAAADLGAIAAELLLRPAVRDVVHAEGPRRYSASDVAAAVSELAGRPVAAQAVPRGQWKAAFERIMPASLAELLVKANDAKNRGGLVDVEPGGEVRRGRTELTDALRGLVKT